MFSGWCIVDDDLHQRSRKLPINISSEISGTSCGPKQTYRTYPIITYLSLRAEMLLQSVCQASVWRACVCACVRARMRLLG
jgi:hypothetical protein